MREKTILRIIIAILCSALVGILAFVAFGNRISVVKGEAPPRPLGNGGILVIAVAINDISNFLKESVKRDNPELPPIQLWDIGTSYKNSNNWMTVSDNLIVIFLHADVSSILTKDELEAVVLHEVGHAKLKHVYRKGSSERVLQEEIGADVFAMNSGAKVSALISAINKLSPDNDEKDARTKVLEQFE